MEHSSEVSGSFTQLKRQGAIISAGLVHNSFDQVQSAQQFGAIYSWMGSVDQVEICSNSYLLGTEVKV